MFGKSVKCKSMSTIFHVECLVCGVYCAGGLCRILENRINFSVQRYNRGYKFWFWRKVWSKKSVIRFNKILRKNTINSGFKMHLFSLVCHMNKQTLSALGKTESFLSKILIIVTELILLFDKNYCRNLCNDQKRTKEYSETEQKSFIV